MTVKATANTGLTQPEVYYIGHLLGETTGAPGGVYTVSFADITPIRSAVGQSVSASSIHDVDKNGTVSFADISAMRPNVGAQLTNITIPAGNASSSDPVDSSDWLVNLRPQDSRSLQSMAYEVAVDLSIDDLFSSKRRLRERR
jgi:hypothetical protein